MTSSAELRAQPASVAAESLADGFSVIVPCFNRAEYIEQTLDSVFAQNHRPIELLVVDDGSTDASVAIVQNWAERHAGSSGFRIVVLQQHNRGAPAARNVGLDRARGEFLLFLDSDDVLAPQKLELHHRQFRADPELQLSIGQACALDAPQRSLHVHREYDAAEMQRLSIIWSPLQTSCAALRRSAATSDWRWDEALQCCQDWEYFTRLVQGGARFGYCLSARSLLRLGDGRNRTGHHGKTIGPRFLGARVRQLRSLWHHAASAMRRATAFRLPLLIQLAQLRHEAIVLDLQAERAALAELAREVQAAAPAWRRGTEAALAGVAGLHPLATRQLGMRCYHWLRRKLLRRPF